MSRPDLYRAGNTTSPRYDNVRQGKDIEVDKEGNVHPGKGGISTFANKDKSWADNKTWVLERATELISGLAARNDHGSLWSIEPSAIMKFDAYKGHLTQLNGKAVRYDRLHEHRSLAKEVEAEETPVPEPRTLKGHVYNAFAVVVQTRTPVEGWDENDYAYIAELAHALENGTLPLSALIWDEKAGWSKERVFAADAVTAHVAQEDERGRKTGDDDEQADINNDNAYLREILRLSNAKNPLAHVA
ncbi:hypothetical protein FOMPIDRAFT_1120767 [Fomitopsis schrenkii]|uniref:Uncharacterized protein n=1 Tax=Fomitopsis schrenkii TaxID=2126942 RepID=S8FIJ5_FOMSC|nr:hypothetical protein FOMPIDRAFT_1120767 [Fomitopsis schrenkii]